MKELQQELAELDTGGVPVELVTISFDPARDTPARLQAYAAELGADTSNWHFVTGEAARLKSIIGGGFGTFYAAREDGTFEFYPTFALVDGWGILRAKYRTAAPDPAIVKRDIKLVVEELNNSDGASRYAYEAAHLFLCYPKY
jgi:protein SCO1/2